VGGLDLALANAMSNDTRKYIFLVPHRVLATLTTNARLSLSLAMEIGIGDQDLTLLSEAFQSLILHHRKTTMIAHKVPS